VNTWRWLHSSYNATHCLQPLQCLLVVTIYTTKFNTQQFHIQPTQWLLIILYGPQNKQRLFPSTKWKCFSTQCSAISQQHCFLESSQASSVCLSGKQRGDEDEALGEWYWQANTGVLEEKPVPLPICPPQITHGQTWARTRPQWRQVGDKPLYIIQQWLTGFYNSSTFPSLRGQIKYLQTILQ
jgi:hypothetical protein